MINPGLFSSATAEWETPQDFYDRLDAEFHFHLDPCATPENARCRVYFTEETDGLTKSWKSEAVFMNPPYGRVIGKWLAKAYHEARIAKSTAVVVCLIPSRTDTRWWHDYVMKANEIRLIKGRLRFGRQDGSAPFPSAIAIFYRHSPKRLRVITMVAKIKEEAQP